MSLTTAFEELGRKQCATFKAHPEEYLELLVTAGSQRSVMFSVYNILRSSGKLTPMEDLPLEFKTDIWQEAQKIAKGRLSKEKMILLARCLYVLNWLLDNPN